MENLIIMTELPTEIIQLIMFLMNFNIFNFCISCKKFLKIFYESVALQNKLFSYIFDNIPRNQKQINPLQDANLTYNLLKLVDIHFNHRSNQIECIVPLTILERSCSFFSIIENHIKIKYEEQNQNLLKKFDSYFNDMNQMIFLYLTKGSDFPLNKNILSIYEIIDLLNNKEEINIYFFSKKKDAINLMSIDMNINKNDLLNYKKNLDVCYFKFNTRKNEINVLYSTLNDTDNYSHFENIHKKLLI